MNKASLKFILYAALAVSVFVMLLLFLFPRVASGYEAGSSWLKSSPAIRNDFGDEVNLILVGANSKISSIEYNCAVLEYFVIGETSFGVVKIYLRRKAITDSWAVYEYVRGYFGAQNKKCTEYY